MPPHSDFAKFKGSMWEGWRFYGKILQGFGPKIQDQKMSSRINTVLKARK